MIDRNEVSQMSKFMSALDDKPTSQDGTSGPIGIPQVNEMKAILERFHSAADNVINETSYDSELREALITEKTISGARIGIWEIQNHQSGKRKFYNIISETGEILANDLMLYEVAHGLVRILNNGGHINCREAIEYLRADQEYAGSVHDMVLFRHRMTQQQSNRRAQIFEARYSESKRRAIKARNTAQGLFAAR